MQAEVAGSTGMPMRATRSRRALTPAWLAFERLRERPLSAALTGLAVATASALVGLGSLVAALSQEDVVGFELGQSSPANRSVRVTYRVPARSLDRQSEDVARALSAFSKSDRPSPACSRGRRCHGDHRESRSRSGRGR
jgi:hypothetical protein